MAIPSVSVSEWVKSDVASASYVDGTITVPKDAVSTTGSIIAPENYSDDIRDFAVAVLDSIYNTYVATTISDRPTSFSVGRLLTSTKLQYVFSVTISESTVDFPSWS